MWAYKKIYHDAMVSFNCFPTPKAQARCRDSNSRPLTWRRPYTLPTEPSSFQIPNIDIIKLVRKNITLRVTVLYLCQCLFFAFVTVQFTAYLAIKIFERVFIAISIGKIA